MLCYSSYLENRDARHDGEAMSKYEYGHSLMHGLEDVVRVGLLLQRQHRLIEVIQRFHNDHSCKHRLEV